MYGKLELEEFLDKVFYMSINCIYIDIYIYSIFILTNLILLSFNLNFV